MRVNKASVFADNCFYASIQKGIVVFVGIEKTDDVFFLDSMAEKIVNLRIFETDEGKMQYSIKDLNYEMLCIPNFTLCAHVEKGRRPCFDEAMLKDNAKKFFDEFILFLQKRGITVKTGVFGSHMDINMDLNGPVNLFLANS